MTTLLDRLKAKVIVDPDTGCWLWQGATSRGYGYIAVGSRQNRPVHRVSYELHVGPIPEGLQLDHLCRIRHCVNPEHLEPVTQQENVLRGVSIVAQHAVKTHCPQGHPYDEANTRLNPRGWRYCIACERARRRRSVRA